MKRIYVLLAKGFEEIEALTPVDVLRRAGFEVNLVSISDELIVIGAHNIAVKADILIDDVTIESADMLILPGGMPGTTNLFENEKVKTLVNTINDSNKCLAAICAAPMILGEMGLLKGKKATCYPGFEKHLHDATVVSDDFVSDGNIITGRGVGAAMAFSLELLKHLSDEATAKKMAKDLVYNK